MRHQDNGDQIGIFIYNRIEQSKWRRNDFVCTLHPQVEPKSGIFHPNNNNNNKNNNVM